MPGALGLMPSASSTPTVPIDRRQARSKAIPVTQRETNNPTTASSSVQSENATSPVSNNNNISPTNEPKISRSVELQRRLDLLSPPTTNKQSVSKAQKQIASTSPALSPAIPTHLPRKSASSPALSQSHTTLKTSQKKARQSELGIKRPRSGDMLHDKFDTPPRPGRRTVSGSSASSALANPAAGRTA